MEFRQKLRKTLQEQDDVIDIYNLAKKMDMRVDPMLVKILEIQREFKTEYENNRSKMTGEFSGDFNTTFFKSEIIDLGFLIQHRVKEIADRLCDKHNTFGHKMFYDQWVLYRGY